MWLQIIGSWVTFPGRIALKVIAYKSSYLNSDETRELYTKSLTIGIWFMIFLTLIMSHSNLFEFILSSTTNSLAPFITHTGTLSPSNKIGASIMMLTTLALVFPIVALFYSVAMSVLTKGINILLGEFYARHIDDPKDLSELALDTINSLGKSYAHARCAASLYIVNVELATYIFSLWPAPPNKNKVHYSMSTAQLRFSSLADIVPMVVLLLPFLIALGRFTFNGIRSHSRKKKEVSSHQL